MPEFNGLIESAVKNGISLVVCLVIIAIFAKILQWVFKFVDKLVTETLVNLTGAIIKLQESIQTMNLASNLTLAKISQDIKDGFDRWGQIAQYQREEHNKIIDKIDSTEKSAQEARERMFKILSEAGCKAKDRS